MRRKIERHTFQSLTEELAKRKRHLELDLAKSPRHMDSVDNSTREIALSIPGSYEEEVIRWRIRSNVDSAGLAVYMRTQPVAAAGIDGSSEGGS